MIINICRDASELGARAADFAAVKINEALAAQGEARLLVSTGSSQFETFDALLRADIDWGKVEVFHLDEYIGIPVTHSASFRKYLTERFISRVKIKKFHEVNTDGDIDHLIRHLTAELGTIPVDVGLIGIGVNGHIAFNDPPADFSTREAYKIVYLDDQCRLQQVNEGWFSSVKDVPVKAISMTPWQIMQCRTIISCVPHKVKALSVRNTLMNKTTNLIPATLLKEHPDFHLYIDYNSASEIIPMGSE
jgi:glucosamine-6-phosphate deaminase